MKLLHGALVTALVATVAGCGGAFAGSDGATRQSARAGFAAMSGGVPSAVRIHGGTAAQDALVQRVVGGFGQRNHIMVVSFAEPETEYAPTPGSEWITLDVRAEDEEGAVFGAWEASLVAAALRDLSASNGLPRLFGKTIRVRLPEKTLDFGSTIMTSPLAETTATNAAPLESRLRARANDADVTLEAVAAVQPLGSAVAIVVMSSDARAFVAQRGLELNRLLNDVYTGGVAMSDGAYVEVRDPRGELVTVSAYASRLREGMGWIAPTFRGLDTSGFGSVSP